MLTRLKALAKRSRRLRGLVRRLRQMRSAGTAAAAPPALPTGGTLGGAAAIVVADSVFRIPGLGVLVVGWCLDPLDELVELIAFADGLGASGDLREGWSRVPRADVAAAHPQLAKSLADPGYLVLVRHPGEIGPTLTIEARLRGGGIQTRTLALSYSPNPLTLIEAILQPVPADLPRLRELFDRHLGPAVEATWNRRPALRLQEDLRWFGERPQAPSISLIVPLYGRHDFMRYQLALFANDPTFKGIELIYVIDDPRIYPAAIAQAAELQPLFGIPFATLHAERNLGYAGANNLGARHARGEALILLNSDVMPRAPGWAPALARTLDQPGAGVVGATLVYEDLAIQHVGMKLEPYAPWGGIPINIHPGKGLLLTTLPEAPQPVESVTGACLAIRRSLYQELGGLDEGYILGDFEDSDLCHRVSRRGLDVLWEPRVVLYHLERQSQSLFEDKTWKSKVTFYNGWRHERRFREARA